MRRPAYQRRTPSMEDSGRSRRQRSSATARPGSQVMTCAPAALYLAIS